MPRMEIDHGNKENTDSKMPRYAGQQRPQAKTVVRPPLNARNVPQETWESGTETSGLVSKFDLPDRSKPQEEFKASKAETTSALKNLMKASEPDDIPEPEAAPPSRKINPAPQPARAEPPKSKPAPELRAVNAPLAGSGWERLDLPSNFVPYLFKTISIRRFFPTDLSKIYKANIEGNFTHLVDALDATVDQDIRELTIPDFYFIMYWQRINSYLKSPFTVKWNSRYGNANESRLDNTTLDIVQLEMDESDYSEWLAKGLAFPTVRDYEILQSEDLSEDQRWLFERAQYMRMDGELDPETEQPYQGSRWIARKFELLDEAGLAGLEEIRDFAQLIEHGVRESFPGIDKKFDAVKAEQHLRNTVAEIRAAAEQLTGSVNVVAALQFANELETEADEIKAAIDLAAETNTPIAVRPRKEEIPLSIDALHFFPGI